MMRTVRAPERAQASAVETSTTARRRGAAFAETNGPGRDSLASVDPASSPRVLAQRQYLTAAFGAANERAEPFPLQSGKGVVQAYGNGGYYKCLGYIGKLSDSDLNLHEDESAEFAERSRYMGSDRAAAFIVNAILPFDDVARIPEVIAAMTAGLERADHNRVAVVLGVNAPKNRIKDLTGAMKNAEQLIQGEPFPVALVRSTFRGKFPYGRMRNEVLHSRETWALAEYFSSSGYHPYVSFQDFDTGSRGAGSDEGPHIFHAVDRVLAGLSEDRDMEGFAHPIRPLMITGGYRPGRQLLEDTVRRYDKAPLKKVKREQIGERLSDFDDAIAEDMRARDSYASLDPLLPYAPEPNLFVDATAVAIPSPLTRTRLKFGPKDAEFTELAKRLAHYAAEELEVHHAATDPEIDPTSRLANLLIDARNNRHPQRGQLFFANFRNMAIATDLSRLALGWLKRKALQAHTNLGVILSRVFPDKRAKKGSRLADVQRQYANLSPQDQAMYRQSMFERHGGMPSRERKEFEQKNPAILGGNGELSKALSVPFSASGPFAGEHYGVSPATMLAFTHQVALQKPFREHSARFLRESVMSEAHRMGADQRYRIGHADGTDHNCTIISIFEAAGVHIGAAEAMRYRGTLSANLLVAETGDIDLTQDVAHAILTFVTQKTGRTYQLSIVAEGGRNDEAQAAQHAVTVHASNGGGQPIFIFFAGRHFSPAWPL